MIITLASVATEVALRKLGLNKLVVMAPLIAESILGMVVARCSRNIKKPEEITSIGK